MHKALQDDMIKLQEKHSNALNEYNTAFTSKIIDYEKSLMLEVKVKLALKDILDLNQKLVCAAHDLQDKRREYLQEADKIISTLIQEEQMSIDEIYKIISSILDKKLTSQDLLVKITS